MSKIDRKLMFLFSLFLIHLVTPSWIKMASLYDLSTWFPKFGFFVYTYFNYLSIPIFTLLTVLYIFSSRRWIFNQHLVYEKAQLKFFCVVIILFCELFYCIKNKEFFPAVMLPTFSTGIHSNEIEITNGFIELYSNNRSYKINIIDLFKSTPVFPIFKKRRENDILKIKEFSYEYKNWIKNITLAHLSLENIDSLLIFEEVKCYNISSKKYTKNQLNTVLTIHYVE